MERDDVPPQALWRGVFGPGRRRLRFKGLGIVGGRCLLVDRGDDHPLHRERRLGHRANAPRYRDPEVDLGQLGLRCLRSQLQRLAHSQGGSRCLGKGGGASVTDYGVFQRHSRQRSERRLRGGGRFLKRSRICSSQRRRWYLAAARPVRSIRKRPDRYLGEQPIRCLCRGQRRDDIALHGRRRLDSTDLAAKQFSPSRGRSLGPPVGVAGLCCDER